MGTFYQAHRSCIQSMKIKYSTCVRQALFRCKIWPESRNLLFFLPQLQIHLQILLLLAVVTPKSPLYGCVPSTHPPHTKSLQLNLACHEITRCFFAGLKYLLAKRYRCFHPQRESGCWGHRALPSRVGVQTSSSLREAGKVAVSK